MGEEARHDKDVKVTLFGQEKDNATAGLAKNEYGVARLQSHRELLNRLPVRREKWVY